MSELTVDGVDMYRFPRGISDSTEVIDAFPVAPIPEQLRPIQADLLGQLGLAQAPISGRRIACILAGRDEGYGGHVVEHSATNIEDPFMMALGKVPPDQKLYGIMVAGEGPIKEKHLMPPSKAYEQIVPLLLPGSPIVLVQPNNKDMCRYIPESMHRWAYSPKAAYVFEGQTVFEIRSEAIHNTALSMEDCDFIAHLRLDGLQESIHYYLTGSTFGLGAPSYAIKPGMYGDLDIIAVSDLDRAQVEACFEDLAEAWYGTLKKEPKVVPVAGTGRTLEGSVYSNDTGISIDFYASSQLEDAFVRPEYLERELFCQLS